MSESRQTHVTLHDIDPQALDQLVQFAYTAEIVVGEGNVQVRPTIPIPASPEISSPDLCALPPPMPLPNIQLLCALLEPSCLTHLHAPDSAPSCQPSTVEWCSRCLLQVPPEPAGPFQLPGHSRICRHTLMQ